eukprot:352473-Chlamydomonas_euryale.AAC.11
MLVAPEGNQDTMLARKLQPSYRATTSARFNTDRICAVHTIILYNFHAILKRTRTAYMRCQPDGLHHGARFKVGVREHMAYMFVYSCTGAMSIPESSACKGKVCVCGWQVGTEGVMAKRIS